MRWIQSVRASVAGAAITAAVLGFAVPGNPDGWAAEAKEGPDQVVEGAKKIGQGFEETGKSIGKTVTEGTKEAGHKAKPVADNLHDRAKGFGEAIWDGMKYVGHTIASFFTGPK